MENCELFENNAKKYLEENVNIKGITFESEGGFDSTISEIHVKHKNKTLFTINNFKYYLNPL